MICDIQIATHKKPERTLAVNDARSVIHIYVTRVEDWSDAALARAERLLDSCERKRAGRFHFEMDRHLFVAAHAMLRQALAQHVAERPERLRFTNTQLGKPVLKLESAIPPQFSLSHSAGIAVCAVSDAHEVGIDVEHAERPMPPGVAERCFAITERAALAALPSAEPTSA